MNTVTYFILYSIIAIGIVSSATFLYFTTKTMSSIKTKYEQPASIQLNAGLYKRADSKADGPVLSPINMTIGESSVRFIGEDFEAYDNGDIFTVKTVGRSYRDAIGRKFYKEQPKNLWNWAD